MRTFYYAKTQRGGGGGGKNHIFYQNRKILEFSKISVLDFKATAVRL